MSTPTPAEVAAAATRDRERRAARARRRMLYVEATPQGGITVWSTASESDLIRAGIL